MLGGFALVLAVVACGGVAVLVVNRESGAARDAAPCEVVAATITVTGAVEGLPDVTFSADGRSLVTLDQTTDYRRWDAATGQQTGRVRNACVHQRTAGGPKQVEVLALPF